MSLSRKGHRANLDRIEAGTDNSQVASARQHNLRVSPRNARQVQVPYSSRYSPDARTAPNRPAHQVPPSPSTGILAMQRSCLKLTDIECVKMLGVGGWAEVYLVRVRNDAQRGPLFALKNIPKRIHRDCERNDQRKNRAEAAEKKHLERRCLTALPWNPFVVGLLDAYTDPRNTYLMLELAPCGSLLDHITRRNSLPHDMANFYFANVILGLEFLHSHGIIHRDIKTENILIGADGYAMITDFGLSQFLREGEDWDRIGTIQYMSPEVIADNIKSHEARYASDWWCAAVMLFEMITCGLPFAGSNIKDIGENLKLQKIQYPSHIFFPQPLIDLFEGMFSYELEKRLGARTVSASRDDSQIYPEGSQINRELRQHRWLSTLRWDRIETRIELAPYVPDPAPDPTREWHRRPLPEKRNVPGLHLKRPSARLEYDEPQKAEQEARRKRRRVDTTQRARAPSPVTSIYAEAGSA